MLISVFITSLIDKHISDILILLPLLDSGNVPSGVPTVLIFTILYFLWNRYLWKSPVINKFTNPPNINGSWIGGLESSHAQTRLGEYASDRGEDTKVGPVMKIDQTWTHISVTIEFEDSISTSTTASFIQDLTDPILRITYRNRPKGSTEDGLTMHEGVNDLRYHSQDDNDILEGKYFTDEHRNNNGQVRFQRD